MSAREQPRALFSFFYLHISFFLCTFAAESCKDDEREPVSTRKNRTRLQPPQPEQHAQVLSPIPKMSDNWQIGCKFPDIWQIDLVEYATYGMDSNLFVSQYELFLPNKAELRKMVKKILS